jgi:hypothetical protein
MTTDTTTPASSNGHASDDEQTLAEHSRALSTALEQHAHGLRSLLEGQLELVERFEAMLRTAKDEERRIQRALVALEGEPTARPGPKPAKPKPTPKPGEWQVSDRKVEQVLDALIEHTANGEAISGNALGDRCSIASETIRRSLMQLRERELVRVAGTSRGGGKLWLPMPDVQERRGR